MAIRNGIERLKAAVTAPDFSYSEALVYSLFFSMRWLLIGAFGGVMGVVLLADFSRFETIKAFGYLVILVAIAEFGFRIAFRKERL